MSEKDMNKYYPSDFDPSKMAPIRLVRPKKKSGPREMNIRMMLPFTFQCEKCNRFQFIGTKFNSRCQKDPIPTPLGLSVYIFRGKCMDCGNEFIFRTDPEASDYVLEKGGVRQHEAARDAAYLDEDLKQSMNEVSEASEDVKSSSALKSANAELRRAEEIAVLRAASKRTRDTHDIDEVLAQIERTNESETRSSTVSDRIDAEAVRTAHHEAHIPSVSCSVANRGPLIKNIKIKPKAP